MILRMLARYRRWRRFRRRLRENLRLQEALRFAMAANRVTEEQYRNSMELLIQEYLRIITEREDES